MFSYWRNKQTGECHISLAGTSWPSNLWEPITADQYEYWKQHKGEHKP